MCPQVSKCSKSFARGRVYEGGREAAEGHLGKIHRLRPSTPACPGIADELLISAQIASDYGKDPTITSILEKMDIFLLPVANPDGYVYTQSQVSNTERAGLGVKENWLNPLLCRLHSCMNVEKTRTRVHVRSSLGLSFFSLSLSRESPGNIFVREKSLMNSLSWLLNNYQHFTNLLFISFPPTPFPPFL